MNKTKVFLLTFAITWITCICLFDHYRDDICSKNTDYSLNESDGENDSTEAISLGS